MPFKRSRDKTAKIASRIHDDVWSIGKKDNQNFGTRCAVRLPPRRVLRDGARDCKTFTEGNQESHQVAAQVATIEWGGQIACAALIRRLASAKSWRTISSLQKNLRTQ